jgi:hypothetical protein
LFSELVVTERAPLPADPITVDLGEIARRIVALAEAAVLEHQRTLERSQAHRLERLVRQTQTPTEPGRWR